MAKDYAIKAVISAVDRFTDPMRKIAGKTLGDFSRKTTNIGKGLTTGLTLPLVGVATASVYAATQLNEQMANVATLIPGSTERVKQLKTEVQDMAIATGKSTEDLAGGLFQVISAFGDTADTVELLNVASRGAVAGSSSTKEAIDLLSVITAGYGDQSAEAALKVSDLAFTTNRLGRTTFPELAASMGQVVPLATELGVAQEELFGVFATNTAISSTSEVATQFKGALQALLTPTEAMSKLFKGMGINSGAALIKQRGLKGALDLVAKAAKLTNQPLSKFIGSMEGQVLALSLTGSLSDTYVNKLGDMGKAAGATDDAFKEQTQGINKAGFTMGQVTQKVAVMSQRLGDGLAPVLFKLLDVITPVVDLVLDLATQFQTLDPTLQTIIVGVGAVAAAMGPVLIVVGALVPIFAALSLPIVAAAVAIGALVAAGVTLYKNWADIKFFVADLWKGIVAEFDAGVAYVTGIIDSIMAKVDRFTSGVAAVGNFLGFGGGNATTSAGQPAASTGRPQASALSALPAQASSQAKGKLEVEFKNAPPGTRITDKTEEKGWLETVTDLGINPLNWGTGG